MLTIKRLKPFWAVYNRSGQLLYRSLQKANCRDFISRHEGQEIHFVKRYTGETEPELIDVEKALDIILNDSRKEN